MSKKNPSSSSSHRSKNDNGVEDEMEVLEKLQNEFNRFDKQKTGKITWKQAKTGFLNLGYNESEVNHLSVVGNDDDETTKKKKSSSKRRKYNNNDITFDQFISYTMNFQIPKKEDNPKEKSQHAFQLLLDHDNNSGAITFHHLKRAAKILGEPFTDEELQEMIDEMDLDGDGQINFQEFLRIMKKVNLY